MKPSIILKDLNASVVVFLVALPLCLGITIACGAPILSGLIAGIVGGIVVGALSGSHTSVSGPAAGLTTVVISTVANLGSFEAFLLALILAGILQIFLSAIKAGIIAQYFPSSVIKGLLAAIGIIIILKQIPHAFGDDLDFEGDFDFFQKDGANTLSEFFNLFANFEPAAIIISLIGLLILFFWHKTPFKKSIIQSSLVVVIVGVLIQYLLSLYYPSWMLKSTHLINIPQMNSWSDIQMALASPDFSQLNNSKIYIAALIIAFVATLETLLNLDAVDKLDPKKRVSPANRELFAQGVGNISSGLLGGLPVTSVIVRSSVNINAQAQTKLSAIFHSIFILLFLLFLPQVLNTIPLAALAAILIYSGIKLASKDLFVEMYRNGWTQFVPFITTIIAILLSDLMIGMIIGIAVSLIFILKNDYDQPMQLLKESYHKEEILRIKFTEQLSFFHKAAILKTLNNIENNTKVMLDGSKTHFMDKDIVAVIDEFIKTTAPEKSISIDLHGFDKEFNYTDNVDFYTTTKEIQNKLTPTDILEILKAGNQRFVNGKFIEVDIHSQVKVTSEGQHPLAIVLGCIDSRSAPEIIFDMSIGDIFSVRLAGNVANEDVVASLEFACKVLGAKLIVVLGHTECGAVKGACDHVAFGNLPHLLDRIQPAVLLETETKEDRTSHNKNFVMNVTKLNIQNAEKYILNLSDILREMNDKGEIKMVKALHHLKTGQVEFL